MTFRDREVKASSSTSASGSTCVNRRAGHKEKCRWLVGCDAVNMCERLLLQPQLKRAGFENCHACKALDLAVGLELLRS